jgi:hypothetical protein
MNNKKDSREKMKGKCNWIISLLIVVIKKVIIVKKNSAELHKEKWRK